MFDWLECALRSGMSEQDAQYILDGLGRKPNECEANVILTMWSEHCSYRISGQYLKQFQAYSAKVGDSVVCAPGENAGAVALGNGQVAVFKMESHNHPCVTEAFNGAATGVGGIMRDVMVMGANIVGLTNVICVGPLQEGHTRYRLRQIVAGISSYGNCIGFPNVGGQTVFSSAYNSNPIVNAMAVGVTEQSRLRSSRARGAGNLLFHLGNKFLWEGVGAALRASQPVDDTAGSEQGIFAQVADPLMGSCLYRALQEILDEDLAVSVQDMGAAGLSCSSIEMAHKGGLGLSLDLDAVPCGSSCMSAQAILLSETQERLLLVIEKDVLPRLEAICKKWRLPHAVIGYLDDSGMLKAFHGKQTVCSLPLRLLSDLPPKSLPTVPMPTVPAKPLPHGEIDLSAFVKTIIQDQGICSRRAIYEQYDSSVLGNTLSHSHHSIGVVSIGNDRALAVGTCCLPRLVYSDQTHGTYRSVAKLWGKLTAVNARPLAMTDCLNFGNPEDPYVMHQFKTCTHALSYIAQALDFPIVSGNVSMYNETRGVSIWPTPVLGGIGIIECLDKRITCDLQIGQDLFLLGAPAQTLDGSVYHNRMTQQHDCRMPDFDIAAFYELSTKYRAIPMNMVRSGSLIDEDGLLLSLVVRSLYCGLGLELDVPVSEYAFWLGGDQFPYLVSTDDAEGVMSWARGTGVQICHIGKVIEDMQMRFPGGVTIDLDELSGDFHGLLSDYLQSVDSGDVWL